MERVTWADIQKQEEQGTELAIGILEQKKRFLLHEEREEKCKIEDKRMVCELPIYKIKGNFYFRDVRLGEYRNIKNPSDRIPINDISSDELQKPTEEDKKEVFK